MSEEQPNPGDLSRRDFVKAASAVAGAGLLGAGVAGAGGDSPGFDSDFANWRVREARRVWDRGYTGRVDRTIGLTDTGVDARHPDVGPWNEIRAIADDDEGELKLTGPGIGKRVELPEETQVTRNGEAPPGTFATRSEVPTKEFEPPTEADVLDAVLTWDPHTNGVNDLELRLDERDSETDDWKEVTTVATANEQEKLVSVQINPSKQYRFVAEQWATVGCTFKITGTFYRNAAVLAEENTDAVFSNTEQTPKIVGWFDEGAEYGQYDMPRDPHGHGTHSASIMAGTGQASVVDVDSDDFAVKVPRAMLGAGGLSEYTATVEVPADSGVFVAAYGENVEVAIRYPEEIGTDIASGGIDSDHSLFDVALVDTPAIHDKGTKTYEIVVRPMAGSAASRLQRVAYGPFVSPAADDGSPSEDELDVSLHAGLAPEAGVVGLQGLTGPTTALVEYTDSFRTAFNMRVINTPWGYPGDLPLGAAGSQLDDTVASLREIARGGILPVTPAGKAATPATGNGVPAVADEAISVAATDPVDGLTSYSARGVGAVDKNTDDGDTPVYGRPDVTAPGGATDGYPVGGYDLVRAALAGDPETTELKQDPIRGYVNHGGTSMASPYVAGVAGLVAQAMEEDAPKAIALPEPAETTYVDVMRLKQAILATASETAFTAAPFHHPSHRPTYKFGGRDHYEGYGRVNPDAAVDAVSRPLVELSDDMPVGRTVSRSDPDEVVGLHVPDDPRAVAGYVDATEAGAGTLEASVSFSHYAGGNRGMTKGDPHLDLFVYRGDEPESNGEPNVVAKAQGRQGSASVTVHLGGETPPEAAADSAIAAADAGTFFVVAKLVNVPGAVNTADVQVHFDLDATFTKAELPAYASATGSRADGGRAFTAGQTDHIEITVDSIGDADAVDLFDVVPESWQPITEHSPDVEATFGKRDETWVYLGTVEAADLKDGSITRDYLVEVPTETGRYTLGPAQARVKGDQRSEFGPDKDSPVGGTGENVVVGVSSDPDDADGSLKDEASTVTDTVSETGDTLNETM